MAAIFNFYSAINNSRSKVEAIIGACSSNKAQNYSSLKVSSRLLPGLLSCRSDLWYVVEGNNLE